MNIKIIIEPFSLTNKNIIANKWQRLEKNASVSVFLSWQWVGNWLDLVTDEIFLIEAYREGEVVGLGFFVETTRKVFGVWPVKQWWLHKTGIQKQDQIWIEYNDFLLDESCSIDVREKMIEAVCDFDVSIKEIIIGLSSSEILNYYSKIFNKFNFSDVSMAKVNGYLVSLEPSKDYLTVVLSKNTRSQIARSEKLLHSQGELNFEVVTTQENIAKLSPTIAKIHIERWKDTPEGSGFLNPTFKNFHEAMADSNVASTIQIAVLSLNKFELGYLINFVYNNTVYFYLSALQKNLDNKIKVGLTLHSKAIQYYIKQGVKSYDFLGGEARYKKSLSNKEYKLEMRCYYRSGLLVRFERKLKSFRVRVVEIFSKLLW